MSNKKQELLKLQSAALKLRQAYDEIEVLLPKAMDEATHRFVTLQDVKLITPVDTALYDNLAYEAASAATDLKYLEHARSHFEKMGSKEIACVLGYVDVAADEPDAFDLSAAIAKHEAPKQRDPIGIYYVPPGQHALFRDREL